MRVYFRVTVAEASATRIEADGSRYAVELPSDFARGIIATYSQAEYMNELTWRMRHFTEAAAPARIEWKLRYSYDSSRLDRERILMLPAMPR